MMVMPGAGAGSGFKSLVLGGWRQFRHVEIEFHPRLTVLTGANGSGKTTVLNLLARHFGWPSALVELPGLSEAERDTLLEIALSQEQLSSFRGTDARPVGRLTYESGEQTAIFRPALPPESPIRTLTDVVVAQQRPVGGISFPAQRWIGQYQQLQAIPPSFNTSAQILMTYVNEVRNRYLGMVQHPGRSPLYYMKEALLAAAVYGEGNSSVRPNPEAAAVLSGFQHVLAGLFPEEVGFRGLYVQAPEVIVSTASGDFLIDAMSGGMMAMTEVAWEIFLLSRTADRFVVCFDEPENHLHPALQRIILPRLLAAFPKVQFVVATHSPFIVGATSDAHVYVLRFGEDDRVVSELLDMSRRAGTANEILRDALGLETTLPTWAEDGLRDAVERYANQELNARVLDALRKELEALGLDHYLPTAVREIEGSRTSGNDSPD